MQIKFILSSTPTGDANIPMSVMNYDHMVAGAGGEHDCFPHAFDIMAIWALYQTVK